MTTKRVLPHNVDVEASILGGIIVRNELLSQLDTLEIDDFYDLKHKVVFEAMRNLEAASKPIDVVTLEHEVEKAGKLDAVGGIAYFGELALSVPTPDNVFVYARIVQDLSTVRKLAFAAGEIVDRCYELDSEPAELLGEALAKLSRLDRGSPNTLLTIGDVAKSRFVELDELALRRAAGDLALTGVPTGIESLDRKIGGWQLGIINELAARPAMGKSAVALASTDAATAAGYDAIVFSLEDTRKAYADRGLSRRSGVPAEKLRQAELHNKRDGVSDYARVGAAVTELGKRVRWHIDDRKNLSAAEIIRAVRKYKAQYKPKKGLLIVVDYIHLVRRNPRLEEPQALDEIMTAFANNVMPDEAWLVLAQLNRKLEERTDKRPILSDLRGSGALEERAKMLVGLYRGVVYGGQPKRDIDFDCDCNEQMIASNLCTHGVTPAEWASQLQAIVLKNSNGQAPCRVFANWRGETLEVW